MKLLRSIELTLSSLLFVIPLLVVESSSASDPLVSSNITRGSSLSTSSSDSSPYWLSPSGNIAFGFYRLPCTRCLPNGSDRYVVGIWFVKSSQQTLVWSTNRNDFLLHKPSSIIFTDEGKLMLRIMPGNKEKPLLPDVPEAASYAKMHDDGNLVLYGSSSQIMWESFDYPSDTILGGQKLRPGIDLISGNYRLSLDQTDGSVAIYKKS
ncbi:hypothetical protein C5167_027091 [Papaver somniferum]|uniref:G-type lectin S-receptor-like serine/threonine-protein kinase LECRK1 isoform X2 n=1 Tax=Papaver somniferum TaxID=3469 RepID=UPI000E705DFF|nr:G-type lectin S-receptor-like serine/threonine-protein kinase LECRK1 isoform X2 [Papaver somniferum]RZC89546.1 hypothetical protein C5167_027091 [Papaver somniferum]